jgi:hypothetical protein
MNVHVRDNLQYLKDVLDGVQSQAIVLTNSFRINAGLISIKYRETDATTDNKVWEWIIDGEALVLRCLNDAESSAGGNNIRITRSGNSLLHTSFRSSGTDFARFDHSAARVLIASGSQSAPGLASLTDSDTGLAWTADGELTLVRNGAAGLRVGSTGVLAPGLSTTVGFGFIGSTGTRIVNATADTMNFDLGDNTTLQLVRTGNIYGQSGPHIAGVGATISTYAGNKVPLVVDRQVSDGVVISIRQDATEEGTISVSGTTVSYNAFLGAHYTQLEPGQAEPPRYGVVVTTGRIVPSENRVYVEVVEALDKAGDLQRVERRHGLRDGPGSESWQEIMGEAKDYFPFVGPATSAGDPAVYGVWMGRIRDDAAGSSFGVDSQPVYQVAGIGLFKVLVTDTGGDIAPGDLLETSARPYLAQRQADRVVRASTLGKAVAGVQWAAVPPDPMTGFRQAVVPVVLYAG